MKWLFIFGSVLIIGCHHPVNKAVALKITGSVHLNKSDITKLKRQKEEIADRLKEASTLNTILEYSLKQRGKTSFKTKLRIWADTSLSAEIDFGNLFSPQKKHLVVVNNVNHFEENINIFVLDGDKFTPVITVKEAILTYLDFSIIDINGDKSNDFVYHWYPSSGCCIRDIYNVYLYQPKTGTFSKSFEFINPTFSPSEKIIRGVGYGQPGDVELYKYKWSGLKVDTIELILPDTITKKFHVFKHWQDFDNPKEGIFISKVPKEYHKIEGYDWFEGN